MDRAFRNLVGRFGASLLDAVTMCSTTPARQLGLTGFGVLTVGAVADVVVLDRSLRVVTTLVDGGEVWTRRLG
jgi:N-acetylglucosamine-6-phosphate deacetylase